MLHQTGSLLIVDDDDANRDMVARRLTVCRYEVQTAADGPEALEKLKTNRFDAVLLDWMMPGMSGLEVLERVRQTRSALDLPVIMATAKGQVEDIVQAFELGANDYIMKPIHFEVLQARLNTHLSLKFMARMKDEFLAMASHDLRNPLSSVNMVAGILYRSLMPGSVVGEDSRKWVDMIRRQVGNMRRIIDSFLEFGRLDDGALELTMVSTDLNDVVSRTVDDNQPYARSKEIRLRFIPGIGLRPIQADPSLLQQVVQNLVGNAIKFSHSGADIVVETRRDGDEDLCEVRDDGPGIPKDEMDRLFLKHSRLSNKPTGGEKSHGIGLFICKRMIELHGGTIGARNNQHGRGSTFWFRVPVERETVTNLAASA